MDKITVAVPCYNEEPVLELFFKEVTAVAAKMPQVEFEFLFIDDGSRDGTLKKIMELSDRDSRVKYISFSRNFGKEAGIYAGLENASGDYVVIMDADLQDPPALLPDVLPDYQQNVRCPDCGRCPGLSDDEPAGGGGHSVHGRVQPVLQGHFRLD